MVDPCILTTLAFKVIEEDFKSTIQEGPTLGNLNFEIMLLNQICFEVSK